MRRCRRTLRRFRSARFFRYHIMGEMVAGLSRSYLPITWAERSLILLQPILIRVQGQRRVYQHQEPGHHSSRLIDRDIARSLLRTSELRGFKWLMFVILAGVCSARAAGTLDQIKSAGELRCGIV